MAAGGGCTADGCPDGPEAERRVGPVHPTPGQGRRTRTVGPAPYVTRMVRTAEAVAPLASVTWKVTE